MLNLKDYQPMGNQVLCQPYIPKKTNGGLLIPLKAQKRTRLMKVIKKGTLCENVAINDIVVLGDTNTTVELTFDNILYVQVPEFTIVGYIRTAQNK